MGGENERQRRAADAYRKSSKSEADLPREDRETTPVSGRKQARVGAFEKVGLSAEARRTGERPPGDRASMPPGEGDTGSRRVARLLISLGPEKSSEILSTLEPEEIQRIAQAVMLTPAVSSEEARELLEAIGAVADKRRPRGGPDKAREMLIAAFGPQRGEEYFRSAVPDAVPEHFDFLSDLEPQQLRTLFRDESAGAIAVVLPHLSPEQAGQLLESLSPELQSDVVRRVSKLGRLNREVVVSIEEALREKIRRQGHQVTQSIDGNDQLAAILRHMAPSQESDILGALALLDPELSRSVKERLYTTDLLLNLSERDLADLLRELGDSEIALFLKGKDEQLRARILRSVSDRRRGAVSEEYRHLGPQKREDVDKITHELLERVRELEEEGTILVPREGDKYI